MPDRVVELEIAETVDGVWNAWASKSKHHQSRPDIYQRGKLKLNGAIDAHYIAYEALMSLQESVQSRIEERRRIFETSQDLILVTDPKGFRSSQS